MVMAVTESGELEKYRKYIQKRRITPPDEDKIQEKSAENSITSYNQQESETRSHSQTPWWEKEAYTLLDKDELTRPSREYRKPKPVQDYRERDSLSDSLTASRRRDHDLYKKLYSRQGSRTSAYPSSYKSYSSQRTQIEDNRATLMAIKLIKQALACFAILGIVVLMQGRPDMQEVLAVIRKHVVETHIEPQNLFEGVKSVFSQLVQTEGGSP